MATLEEITQAVEVLSETEVAALINTLVQLREQKQLTEAQMEAVRRDRIAAAVTSINNLIGDPQGTAPDEVTIYGMLRHDDATIAANLVTAIRLNLENSITIATTVRDLALVVGS